MHFYLGGLSNNDTQERRECLLFSSHFHMFQLLHFILLENNGKNLLIKYLYKDTMLLAVVIFMSTEGREK